MKPEAAASANTSPLREALLGCKSVYMSVAAFSAVINLLMLAPAIYMLQVYDRVISSQNSMTLLMLSLILLGLYLLMAALEFIRSRVLVRLGTKLDIQLSQQVYSSSFIASLRKGGFNANQSLGDLNGIRQFLTGNPLLAFFDAPWVPVYLAVIYMFDVWLGLFATVGSLVLIGLAILNEKLTQKPLQAANQSSIKSGYQADSVLRNAEVIEAMGMLPALRQRWFQLHQQFLDHHRIASEKAGSVAAASRGIRITLQSMILGLAALLVISGEISAGMMIAASILMGRALAPVDAVIGAWKQWTTARQSYHRLSELLQACPPPVTTLSLPAPSGELSIEHLSAAIPGTRQVVLSRLNFQLPSGSVLGVLGPSGSGKSTLARLLVGVWPAASGKVRLDGADIFRWNKAELGPSLGYLPQDVELFAGSISDNIARFGEVDAEQVIAAAKLAGIHELILQKPDGYETLLGENGRGLSGGQRQRVGLARALYRNPALLVLDEPDASLDDAGEQALKQAIISQQHRGGTVVVITHRPALVSSCSHLLVLADGQMRAFGPREQVLSGAAKKIKPTPEVYHSPTVSFSTAAPSSAPESPSTPSSSSKSHSTEASGQ
ncbi:type I secretion system permease/ATPase [Oceanobacter sp. 5_MG-2023]|uniref:type I secretion system permease/ATPase n=1 Tax=Oceanobacter sp. 5_MG-2023 TaxID=3062645 RepID=UPI0026E39A9E|nr:type I secretion system permease/ATPase [Oceanobacter sp. 5_MG-2023]MDO6682452.1 type I secretion system permease/ATPase [Oceanobacter sp. 5_MG-2023]